MVEMLGLDLLALSFSGYLTMAQAAGGCSAQGRPTVNVTAATKDVRYDFRRTKAQLSQMDIDTISPYAHNHNTFVGGLMSGQIEVQSSVNLAWSENGRTRKSCFWYDKVNIHLEIDPTILVAREFPRGSCKHNAIIEHENKHIAVDRIIVKKYRKIMEDYINNVVRTVDGFGPVPSGQIPRIKKKMGEYMEKAVTKVTQSMYAERRQRQQAIDSKAEYDRVAALCE